MDKATQKMKIIFLATACDLTNIIYTRLSQEIDIALIIIENNISKKTILKKRAKKLGLLKVFGQLLFLLLIAKPQRLFSSKRKAAILIEEGFSEHELPTEKIQKVGSVNDFKTIQLIQKENPDLILVNGTRIISSEVINCTKARFINIHAGITPLYRGVHGAYWAMAMGDIENCGVTIHYVDKGIDTGGILAQGIIQPTTIDNFTTYPYLQFTLGANLFIEVIKKFESGILIEQQALEGLSKLWHHPTIGQYLYYKFTKGVK